jgi:hypothetical protein
VRIGAKHIDAARGVERTEIENGCRLHEGRRAVETGDDRRSAISKELV